MESSEEWSSWGLPSEFSVSPSEMACMGAENSLLRMLYRLLLAGGGIRERPCLGVGKGLGERPSVLALG